MTLSKKGTTYLNVLFASFTNRMLLLRLSLFFCSSTCFQILHNCQASDPDPEHSRFARASPLRWGKRGGAALLGKIFMTLLKFINIRA